MILVSVKNNDATGKERKIRLEKTKPRRDRMKKHNLWKRMSALVTIAALAASCAGCGGAKTAETTAAAATADKAAASAAAETEKTAESNGDTTAESGDSEVLKVAVQSLPATLDANAKVSNAGIQVYYNIYDTLIMRDSSADEPTFLPGLAESWEQINDLTWEFKLREGVQFHDGTTMDAEDVEYSMNRVINQEDASYATTHSYLLGNFEKFEAVDELTVRAYTTNPEPLIENLLSDPNVGISSKEYCENVGLDAASLMPATTGPYKVVSFDPSNSVVLERFDEYWGEKAPFERIEFKCVPEVISRITALQNGEVDFITNIPPDQEAMLESNPNVKLQGELMSMYHIYRMNMSHELMDDPNFRAALDYAIDRQALVDAIWLGKAEAATTYQFYEVGDELYLEEREGEITYDLEKAKELLAASDYAGETIQLYDTTDYYTYLDLTSQALIDMWKQIGVNAEYVEADDLSTFNKEDMTMRSWSNPLYYQDPMGVLDRHWMPGGEANLCGHFVTTDEYVEQYQIARYSTDVEERKEALNYIYDYFRSETPFIYLYKTYESVATSDRINYELPKNVRVNTLGFRAGEISVNK